MQTLRVFGDDHEREEGVVAGFGGDHRVVAGVLDAAGGFADGVDRGGDESGSDFQRLVSFRSPRTNSVMASLTRAGFSRMRKWPACSTLRKGGLGEKAGGLSLPANGGT